MVVRIGLCVAMVCLAGCSHARKPRAHDQNTVVRPPDPPLIVPWRRVGDIALGARRDTVERIYGPLGNPLRTDTIVQGSYNVHGTELEIEYDGGRVNTIEVATPYYRTRSGFGVGSRVPIGGRWHGFIWNPTLRDQPCSCWVKVGEGPVSLSPTGANFGKPWTIVSVHRGRVTRFFFARVYVD